MSGFSPATIYHTKSLRTNWYGQKVLISEARIMISNGMIPLGYLRYGGTPNLDDLHLKGLTEMSRFIDVHQIYSVRNWIP